MKEMIFSGFGGQGVLTTGNIVADVALAHDMYATWIPSYGAEMRGGRAYCIVKADPVRVGTPSLEEADVVLAMNAPSLSFAEKLRTGGVLLVNSDIIDDYRSIVSRTDIRIEEVPFDSLARTVQNPTGANVIAAGVVVSLLGGEFDENTSVQAMKDYFAHKGKTKFEAENTNAFLLGYHYLTDKEGQNE